MTRIASIAHDFNNVMMGIVTFVEVLKRHREGASIERAVQGLEKAVKRGRAITDEVLRDVRLSR